jgi:hypothetical protein
MAVKITHVDIGDRMTPQATFTVASSPTDPTQIVVKRQDTAGTETTITTASSPGTLTTASTPLARMSVGVFKLSPGISATALGYEFFRFEASGTAESAEDFQYNVDPSEFYANAGLSTRALVTLVEMKEWLNVQNVDTANDLEIVSTINSVSELAHNEAEREFMRADTTSSPTIRLFPVDQLAYQNGFVQIGDLSATPTLVRILGVDWTTSVGTITDYATWPRVRQAWEPITALQWKQTALLPQPGQLIEVTGVWGFPAIPTYLKDAVKDAVVERLDRDVEHYRQDLSPAAAGPGQNVIVFGSNKPSFLPVNPRSLSVFRSFKEAQVGC